MSTNSSYTFGNVEVSVDDDSEGMVKVTVRPNNSTCIEFHVTNVEARSFASILDATADRSSR